MDASFRCCKVISGRSRIPQATQSDISCRTSLTAITFDGIPVQQNYPFEFFLMKTKLFELPAYQIVMLVLSFYALASLAVQVAANLDPEIRSILDYADY